MHLLETAQELDRKEVNLVSLRENIDTNTATGRCFISMMGAIHQTERELLRLLGVPSENGPYRTLGHRGSRNPPVQGWDGDSEVTGHIARRYSAREKLFG